MSRITDWARRLSRPGRALAVAVALPAILAAVAGSVLVTGYLGRGAASPAPATSPSAGVIPMPSASVTPARYSDSGADAVARLEQLWLPAPGPGRRLG